MGNAHRPKSSLEGAIYTLAQSTTNDIRKFSEIPEKMVFGKGSDSNDKRMLQGRARKKFITQMLVRAIADVAKVNGDMNKVKQCWNAYYCRCLITKSEGRIYGNYCKTRFCLVCLGIRKAKIINQYLPIIKTWESPHLITLTAKAVKASRLSWQIKNFKVAFKRIKDRLNKRYERGKGIPIMGIKSLECNFNPILKTYNPHFHLIVPNEAVGHLLIEEWEKTWNTQDLLVSEKAQDCRKIFNNEKALIEVVKYGAKIFTDPEMKGKGKSNIPPVIYAAAMYNIFSALKGNRLFDRFGFNIPKPKCKVKYKSKFLTEYEEMTFDKNLNDWVNEKTGELLTGYVPTAQLDFLLGQHIDTHIN